MNKYRMSTEYDRQRRQYETCVQIGRIVIKSTERSAACNELWLANIEALKTQPHATSV